MCSHVDETFAGVSVHNDVGVFDLALFDTGTRQNHITVLQYPLTGSYYDNLAAAVKSLLTVMVLLQQKPCSERCAQCKWR